MSHLSQRTSKPEYYIVDYRILFEIPVPGFTGVIDIFLVDSLSKKVKHLLVVKL